MTIHDKKFVLMNMRWAPYLLAFTFTILFFSVIWVRLPIVYWPVGLLFAGLKLCLDFFYWRSCWHSDSKKYSRVSNLVDTAMIVLACASFRMAEAVQFFFVYGTGYLLCLLLFRERILAKLQVTLDQTF